VARKDSNLEVKEWK